MSPFNWLSYLDVAENLMLGGSEAHFRSAVSRAYYGVFGETRSRLEGQGIRFQRENIHHKVIKWLKDQPQDSVVQIGVELDRLRVKRNHADYDAIQTFTDWRAKLSILEARSLEKSVLRVFP